MANILYPLAAKAFLDADIDLLVNDVKVILTDLADYTYNAAHQFLTDVPVAARVATSPNLVGKTTTAGVFDANDFTFGLVAGDPSEALIIYQDTGVAATSRLVAFLDTMTGLPVTPSGAAISVTWGAFIFQIAGTCP